MKIAKLPSVFLALVIQFTPLAARLAQSSPALAASPLAIILKWIAVAAAVGGSFHTVSAATAKLQSASTINGKVGTPLTYKIIISDGQTRTPGAWDLNGVQNGKTNGLPNGLALSLTTGIISGTPKQAGTFPVTVKAYEHSNRTGAKLQFTLTFNIQDTAVAPVISVPPADQTADEGGTATFSVTATGTSLTYQWLKEDVDIQGQTGTSLVLSNLKTADSGLYKVRVTSGSLSTTSAAARLTVHVPTTISVPPAPVTVHAGEKVTLNVSAAGEGTLTYQWKKGATFLAGQTGSSLVINGATPDDAGDYSVVVTGAAGTATSTSAKVTVLDVPTADAVVQGDTVIVHFSAIPGRAYAVESSDSLVTPSWQKRGTVNANAAVGTFSEAPPNGARFWRVKVETQ